MSNWQARGFTLIEVLVAMMIVALLAGGYFSLSSGLARSEAKVEVRLESMRVLQCVAERILIEPRLALELEVNCPLLNEGKAVRVEADLVEQTEAGPLGPDAPDLYRVHLELDGGRLDFSLIVDVEKS